MTISGRKLAAVLGDLRMLVSSPDGGPNSGLFAIAIVYEAATGRKPTKPIESLRTGDRYLDRAFAATLAMPPAERPTATLAYLLIYSEVVDALTDQEIAALGTWFLGQRLAVDIPGKALLASGRLPDGTSRQLRQMMGLVTTSLPVLHSNSTETKSLKEFIPRVNLSGFTTDPGQLAKGRAEIKASYGAACPGPYYTARGSNRLTLPELPLMSPEEAERIRSEVRDRNKASGS